MICREINKYLAKEKPDPNNKYLVIGLREIVDSNIHTPKLEHKDIIQE